MKKIEKFFVGAACMLALTFSTGAFIKVYPAETSSSVPGQPVDLTYAALDSVILVAVHVSSKYKHRNEA